jgi:octaprenyl-diphosphate synthase
MDLSAVHRPIGALLARELEEVALIFERQLASELSAVNALCVHVEHYRGKMLRPTLVVLSGLAATGGSGDGAGITGRHRTLAAVIEMIHMATLVHDDVLDEAEVRRRGATVNHLWGNETAVMLGDYLISNAFHLCSTMGDPSINLALGEVTNTLCAGELAQLHHRNDFGLDEETYFEIVRRKTASLIGAACRLGAILAGAAPPIADGLGRAGIALGTAFQLQDDLLDLVGDETVVGKSLGRDLAKGKVTLPVIVHLQCAEPSERGAVLRLVERADAPALRERLIESGAVDVARAVARGLVDDARSELALLPDGPARAVFAELAESVILRRW